MQYTHAVVPGTFLVRPNRFIAHVEVDGQIQVCHVRNTGRCRELLIPGTRVWLEHAPHPKRRTAYSLIAVEKQRPGRAPLLINMDSQAPNRAFEARALTLFPDCAALRREVTFGDSRFDFMLEGPRGTTYVEVKGVTLEEDGIALFPDAPTLRGVKHIEGLMAARAQGFGACICFVIQMGEMRAFRPNDLTHPAFGDALRRARAAGVDAVAYGCRVTPGTLVLDAPVPIEL